MIDIQLLRNDPETVAKRLAKRGVELNLELFSTLENDRYHLQVKTEKLQAQRNALSRQIGEYKKSGKDCSGLLKQVAEIGEALTINQVEFENMQVRYRDFVAVIPNMPDDSVPLGKDSTDNVEIKRVGEPKKWNFSARDHVEIGELLGGIDSATAAKVSQSRFIFLRGEIARLHRALAQFMLDMHTASHGYQEIYAPYLVNRDSMFGTGQLPKFSDDLFQVISEGSKDQVLYLIPTAEVPITNLVRDEIISMEELPLRYVCHSPCFRAEAGSYGKDTRGMIRQHQFDKVELVQITHPQDSLRAHEELTEHAESVLIQLGLPFRRVLLCAGDMGFAASKTYDLEVWLPGQNTYREISSCSNFLDFQGRRMQARFRNAQRKTEFLHTLNGSALAVGRTLVAVLENYQEEDGSVVVPEALRKWMGNTTRIQSKTK